MDPAFEPHCGDVWPLGRQGGSLRCGGRSPGMVVARRERKCGLSVTPASDTLIVARVYLTLFLIFEI